MILLLTLFTFISQADEPQALIDKARVEGLMQSNTNLSYGPNCWNSVMYSLGHMEEVRYVGPAEFSFFLQENCREVSKNSITPGAVIRIHSEDYFEQHAALYMREGRLFEKGDFTQTTKYSYRPLEDLVIKFKKSVEEQGPHCYPVQSSYCREILAQISYYQCRPARPVALLNSLEAKGGNSFLSLKMKELFKLLAKERSEFADHILEIQKEIIMNLTVDNSSSYLKFLTNRHEPIWINHLDQKHLDRLKLFAESSLESLKAVLMLFEFQWNGKNFEGLVYRDFIGEIVSEVKKQKISIFWMLVYKPNFLIINPQIRKELLLKVQGILFEPEHQMLLEVFKNNFCSSSEAAEDYGLEPYSLVQDLDGPKLEKQLVDYFKKECL